MGIKIYDLDSDEETKESKKRRTKERIAKEEKSFAARTGSDANTEADFDRAVEKLLGEGSRDLTDADRARAEKSYIELNDGGMAMSGRGKPVRTF